MASPVPQSSSEAQGSSATPTITEPASAASGDLLIAVVGSADTGTAITGLTGWTQLAEGDDGVGNRYWYGWIIRGASAPDLVAAAANANWVANCVRIDGHDATTPIGSDHGTATGTSTTPQAPAVDPGTSRDHLSILGVVQEGKNDNRFTDTTPSGYTEQADIGSTGGGAGTGHIGGAMNSRAYTGQTETPGTHTSSRNDGWIAITIIVRPVAGTDYTESKTEAVGVTDSTPIKQGKVRAEAVGVADIVSRVHDAERVRTEPVGVADSTPVKQGKVVTEPVGVSDQATPAITKQRSKAEPVGVSDTVTPAQTHRVTITEAIGVTDTTTRVAPAVREINEPIGVTDETPVKQGKRISEAVGVADSTIDALSGDTVEVVTEPVGVSDATQRQVDAARSVVEPVGISDTVLPAKFIRVTITESVGVADATAPAKTARVVITEDVGVADGVARQADWKRDVTEAVGAADATVRDLDYVREVVESIGVTDLVADNLVLAGAGWWSKDPTPAVKDPTPHTKNPTGFTKVKRSDPSPW